MSNGSSSPRAERDGETWGARSLLRAVNQQVARIGATAAAGTEFDYVCECADSTCYTVVRLPRSDYARIVEIDGWFVVADGHGTPEEEIVEQGTGYVVVTRASG